MYRTDWLMQQLEDGAACLAAVFGYRVAGQPAEARIELEGAALRLLGIDPATLSLFSDEQVLDLLSSDGQLQADRCLLAGWLLAEDAEIQAMLGKSPDAGRARSRRFAEAAWTARPDLRDEPTLGVAAWKARFG